MKQLIQYMAAACLLLPTTALTSCTDLDERLYDQVASPNYYNTKDDVIRAVLRPFEHSYWSIQNRHVLNEESADQLITPARDSWWEDGGLWRRLHQHQWKVTDGTAKDEYNGCYQGIMQACHVIEDMDRLSASQFGFSEAEFDNLRAQNRVLRAWFYLRLLDEFRNVPLAVSYYDQSRNSQGQVEPRVVFDFVEKELTEALPLLVEKTSAGGNKALQGQFTKAAAAALLVRLYLNAQVYVGEDRSADCMKYAQDIVDQKYGVYSVGERWDAVFDWNNETSDEVIFAFPGGTKTHWHYQGDTFWWTVPANAKDYLRDPKNKQGNHNCKYACSPSLDPTGQPYTYELGMTVSKFRKYEGDVRLKLYRNTGGSTREGMFLYGSLPYTDDNGQTRYVTSPNGDYNLYIRDAVGKFQSMPADKWLSNSKSDLTTGDHNSGWHYVKYPLYSDDDEGQLQSDYVEIRLPEVIYSLAECKLRQGDKAAAARLLNGVRRRYYPAADFSRVLYAPEGTAVLNEQELLDEWGREFLGEGRRRIDLIRFGRFEDKWWDKEADADEHTRIFPLHQDILGANKHLRQNPGYDN